MQYSFAVALYLELQAMYIGPVLELDIFQHFQTTFGALMKMHKLKFHREFYKCGRSKKKKQEARGS